LISALDGGEWPASRPAPGKDSGTHWIGGWVGLRGGLNTEDRGKILRLGRGSNPGVILKVKVTDRCGTQLQVGGNGHESR
jgi:hypothetical protein